MSGDRLEKMSSLYRSFEMDLLNTWLNDRFLFGQISDWVLESEAGGRLRSEKYSRFCLFWLIYPISGQIRVQIRENRHRETQKK